MKLTLNGQEQILDGFDPGMPLLGAEHCRRRSLRLQPEAQAQCDDGQYHRSPLRVPQNGLRTRMSDQSSHQISGSDHPAMFSVAERGPPDGTPTRWDEMLAQLAGQGTGVA